MDLLPSGKRKQISSAPGEYKGQRSQNGPKNAMGSSEKSHLDDRILLT
jgi:hypothetical protein